MLRGIGVAITWILAPLAGLATLNLLVFAYYRFLDRRYGDALDSHQGMAAVAAAILAAWVALTWLIAKSRDGRARRNYLGVICALILGGVAASYVLDFMSSGGTTVERIR